MLSRSRSAVFSKNGSMLRSSVSRFGASGVGVVSGSRERSASDDGKSRAFFAGGACGSSCRNDVSRCELWICSGSSTRMSWNLRLDF